MIEDSMTLSFPFFELPEIVLAVGIALVVGMAIGSAATAAAFQRRRGGERS
jgi:hypothetical protein